MSSLRILAIEPWCWEEEPRATPSSLQRWARPGTQVYRIGVDVKWAIHSSSALYTPHGIFSDQMAPDTAPVTVAATVAMMERAQAWDYDAVCVPCFADTGILQGRSTVKIPLVGACYASLHLANMLGQSYSVITNFAVDIPHVVEMARFYGLGEKLRSLRAVDMSTRERSEDFARGNPATNRRRLLAAARQAIEIDGAEVVVGGCTSEGWFELGLQDELGVPVVDAAVAALKMAELQADLYRSFGLSHSRVGYYFPRGTFYG